MSARETAWTSLGGRLPALAAPALAAAGAALVLRLWAANFHAPLDQRPDAIFNMALVKGMIEHGSVLANPSLGAPAGQRLDDFPVGGDFLHLAAVRGLTLLSHDPVIVVNLYFLLSFPVVAAVAWWMLRRLAVSPWSAAVAAALFSLLPYHFVRGPNHLFLASYFAVPLGAVLVLALLGGDPLAAHERRFTLLAALTIGFSSFYYAVLTCALALLAATLRGLAERRRRPLLAAFAIVGVIGIGVSVALSPALVRRWRDGPNRLAGQRSAAESEGFALKLTQLVLPIEHHRVPALAELKRRYVASAPLLGEAPDAVSLGAAGTGGLVWLTALLFGYCASGGAWPRCEARERHAAVAAGLAFAVGTVGGLSSLAAYLIHPQIRCWGRLSVFIAFFALFALACRIDSRARHPATRASLLVAVLVLGFLDQTSPAQVPDYPRLYADFQSDRDLVAEVERRLPAGAAVFQLPYVPFPESPPMHRLHDSAQLRPYLHSRSLRWSYGAMKGRADDWAAELADESIATAVRGVAAAGFAGLTVDRLAYEDHGAALEAAVGELAGERPLASPDGRVSFFDLRPLARRLALATPPPALEALGRAVLTPLRCEWGQGFFAEERSAGSRWRWAERAARLDITNSSSVERLVTLEAALAGQGAGTVEATWPDGSRERLPLGIRWVRSLRLPPGRNLVEFTNDLPRAGHGDARDLHLLFVDPACRDAQLSPPETPGAAEEDGHG
jgi:phosphoglycerol transferase